MNVSPVFWTQRNWPQCPLYRRPIVRSPRKLILPMLLGILIGLLTACSGTPIQETAAVVISDTAPETEVEVVETPDRPFPADSLYDLLVAEFAVRRNRYDLALGNYLQQAHQTQDPGVTARATRLAQFLRADKATLDAAQLWVDLEPENSEAQYTLATMLAKNKRPLEAMTHMTRVLENGGSTNFAAIAASALPLPETSRYAIEQEIEQLLLQYPGNTQLLTSKSLLYQQRGEIKQALAIIRQVLLIDDSELHAVIVEARLLQQLNRDEEAFQRLETVVAQHPNNRRLRLQYARMLMRKDITLAKLQFEILLAAAPNDADLLLSLGLISKESNQIEDAQRYFKHLLAGGQRENEANYYLAQLAEQREDWPSAIAYYQQIPPGSDFLAAVNRIKTLYMKQGRDDTAREYLQSQRQRYPEHSVRLYLLESEMLLTSGDIDGSHKLLTEALLITPNQASLLYARSMTAEKLGLIELMEKDLRNIIAQDENNATALNALGYVLANRTDRYDEAYELVSRALQTKPGDPAILDSLGWIEYRRGNLQRAHEILLQAYKAFPDPEVAAHLGEVLWQLGQQQQAIKIWQQGLAKNPDSSFINEAMQRLLPDEAVPDPASQSLIEKAE